MKYILIALSMLLLACSTNEDKRVEPDIEELSSTVEYKKVSGVESNLLSLDIYYTGDVTSKKPVIIWVHGGAWCIGDKANQIQNKVKLFHSLNYVLVSINYRLSPFPYEINNTSRVKFPSHNNDVADAIKWVSENIDKYGGNSDKMALLGHSAGAHLVALTGTNSSFLENVGLSLSSIKGVAAIDTEGYDVHEQVKANNKAYINAFGLNANSNIAASPLFNIKQGTAYPKFFIAKRGGAERLARANAFINTLKNNGVAVSEVDGSIYDHNGINTAIGETDEELITNALTVFYQSCFE